MSLFCDHKDACYSAANARSYNINNLIQRVVACLLSATEEGDFLASLREVGGITKDPNTFDNPSLSRVCNALRHNGFVVEWMGYRECWARVWEGRGMDTYEDTPCSSSMDGQTVLVVRWDFEWKPSVVKALLSNTPTPEELNKNPIMGKDFGWKPLIHNIPTPEELNKASMLGRSGKGLRDQIAHGIWKEASAEPSGTSYCYKDNLYVKYGLTDTKKFQTALAFFEENGFVVNQATHIISW